MANNNKINKEQLNKEYSICQETTRKIENTIWSTSTAIGIGSLAPLITLIITDKIEAIPAAIIGLLIFFISLVWFWMATRWWDIQHVTFMRMKHIEEFLGIYQIRYICYCDGRIDLEPNNLSFTQKNLDDLKGKENKSFHLRGVQKWLRLLPYFILFSWVEYSLYLFFIKDQNCCNWLLLLWMIIFIVPYIISIVVNLLITRKDSKEGIKKIKNRYK